MVAIQRFPSRMSPAAERRPPPLPGAWKMWVAAGVAVIALLKLWHDARGPFVHGRGAAYANRTETPLQDEHDVRAPFDFKGFRLAPVAHFDVKARLLMRTTYVMDRGAKLAPVDFALGWNRMADDAVLKRLTLSQGGRFYFYQWQGAPPIPGDEIISSSANMHLIPADRGVESALREAPVGGLVHLEGMLVDASQGGWTWRTSRTRTDTGDGACELFFVEQVSSY